MSEKLDYRNENEEMPPNDCCGGEPSEAKPSEAGPIEAIAAPTESVEREVVPPSAEVAENQARPAAASAESHLADAVLAEVGKLHDAVCELRQLFLAQQDSLANLGTAMDTTAKQVTFLPPQVRMLGGKIDGLTTSISEGRYRAVLLSLLGVYDLVDQVLRTLPPGQEGDAEGDHRRNYEVLCTQLRQILEANGLSEIPTTGIFDPKVHRALRRVPVADAAQANRVLEVVRPGFRTEQSILRYAEVLVGHYMPTENVTGEDRAPASNVGASDVPPDHSDSLKLSVKSSARPHQEAKSQNEL